MQLKAVVQYVQTVSQCLRACVPAADAGQQAKECLDRMSGARGTLPKMDCRSGQKSESIDQSIDCCGQQNCISLTEWISDARSQKCTDVQSRSCLDHEGTLTQFC